MQELTYLGSPNIRAHKQVNLAGCIWVLGQLFREHIQIQTYYVEVELLGVGIRS